MHLQTLSKLENTFWLYTVVDFKYPAKLPIVNCKVEITCIPPQKNISNIDFLELISLQEALEDREKQIQTLLAEREFEQAEAASATSQIAKVG